MVSKSQLIHQLFEECQEEIQLLVRSLKQINTVRHSAREFCFWYVSETVWFCYDHFWENNCQHSLWYIQTERFKLHANPVFYEAVHGKCLSLLFREVFGMTRPISRILQGVNIEFGKAWIFLMLLLINFQNLQVIPKWLSKLLRKMLMESSGKKREFQERDGCLVSFPKTNLQSLQKPSGNLRYSTQLFIPLLPE